MDNSSDKEQKPASDRLLEDVSVQSPDTNRRRFARSAVVGSAVFLSLGNRAAWGIPSAGTCMSVSILDSFTGNNNVFASAHPDHISTDASDILAVQNDVDHLKYPDLRVETSGTPPESCIVEVAYEPDNGFSGPLTKDKTLRTRPTLGGK